MKFSIFRYWAYRVKLLFLGKKFDETAYLLNSSKNDERLLNGINEYNKSVDRGERLFVMQDYTEVDKLARADYQKHSRYQAGKKSEKA